MRWQRCHLTTTPRGVFLWRAGNLPVDGARRQDDPLNLKGSFAGAMGYGQLCRRLTNNMR